MSTILNLGKYKGKTIQEVYDIDQGYSRWLLNQELLINDEPEIKEFLSSKFDSNDKSYLLTWGRHKSKTIKWVFDNDKQYFSWLAKNQYVKDKCKKLWTEIEELST
jgi:hypothetical protein